MGELSRSLLTPGHESDWQRINESDDAERREHAAALTVEERILETMQLSRLAAEIKQVAARNGHRSHT
jgi:hypothetical protein